MSVLSLPQPKLGTLAGGPCRPVPACASEDAARSVSGSPGPPSARPARGPSLPQTSLGRRVRAVALGPARPSPRWAGPGRFYKKRRGLSPAPSPTRPRRAPSGPRHRRVPPNLCHPPHQVSRLLPSPGKAREDARGAWGCGSGTGSARAPRRDPPHDPRARAPKGLAGCLSPRRCPRERTRPGCCVSPRQDPWVRAPGSGRQKPLRLLGVGWGGAGWGTSWLGGERSAAGSISLPPRIRSWAVGRRGGPDSLSCLSSFHLPQAPSLSPRKMVSPLWPLPQCPRPPADRDPGPRQHTHPASPSCVMGQAASTVRLSSLPISPGRWALSAPLAFIHSATFIEHLPGPWHHSKFRGGAGNVTMNPVQALREFPF